VDYKDLDGNAQSCDFENLRSRWDSVRNKAIVAGMMKAKLAELSNFSPGALQLPLWRMQELLDELPTANSQSSAFDKLDKAIADFRAAAEERRQEEASIKAAERRIVPPCVRFGETLDVVAAYDAWEEAPYAKEAAFLDAWLAKR